MKSNSTYRATHRFLTCLRVLALIAGIGVTLMALPARQALANTVTYKDTDNKKELDNPGTTYVISKVTASHTRVTTTSRYRATVVPKGTPSVSRSRT